MRARFRDYFLAMLGVHLHRGMVLPMVPVGTKESGNFAHDFCCALFEAIDGWFLAINVVAHFGFRHSTPHCGRGACNGVAS